VLVDVTNTGNRRRQRGRATVHPRPRQLRHPPVKELKGFRRKSSLEPGENLETVALEITPESLAFYDIEHEITPSNPANFEIMVGNSSRDADLQKVVLTGLK
jgi:beta-glucosidase